jgi:hypothetical protein
MMIARGTKFERWMGRFVALPLALLFAFASIGPASAVTRHDVWRSPAGSVECRMYMNGSQGRYTLACLVVKSNTLLKWGGDYPTCATGSSAACRKPAISKATATQKAQFKGAFVAKYGQSFSMGTPTSDASGVSCSVSPTKGSTCQYSDGLDARWINFNSGHVRICAYLTLVKPTCTRII